MHFGLSLFEFDYTSLSSYDLFFSSFFYFYLKGLTGALFPILLFQ